MLCNFVFLSGIKYHVHKNVLGPGRYLPWNVNIPFKNINLISYALGVILPRNLSYDKAALCALGNNTNGTV